LPSESDDPSDTYDDASAVDEDEAAYENQPAAGLSPRLVLKRAVEMLQEGVPTGSAPPALHRVETFAAFEQKVSKSSPLAVDVPSEVPRTLERTQTIEHVGVLSEVADAFSAVEELASPRLPAAAAPAPASSDSEGRRDSPLPPVRRVDTMDLLAPPPPLGGSSQSMEPPSKRVRAADGE